MEAQLPKDETFDMLMNLNPSQPMTPTLPDLDTAAGGGSFVADNQLAMSSSPMSAASTPKAAMSTPTKSSDPSTASSPETMEYSPDFLKKRAVEMYKNEHGGKCPEQWASPVEEAQWAFRGLDLRSILGYRKPAGQRFDRALKHDAKAGTICKDLDDECKLLFKAVWSVNKTFAFTDEKRAASM